MTPPTTLFLDIDGVFTMMDCPDLKMERVGGIHCRPIPMANALLQTIDKCNRLVPIWLSSWDIGSLEWNRRANTLPWYVGYHLTEKQEKLTRNAFPWDYPELDNATLDKKLVAAQSFLWFQTGDRQSRAVWIEDGFAPETLAWAKERNSKVAETILIDTTKEPIRSELLSTYEDYEQSAKMFMEKYIL